MLKKKILIISHSTYSYALENKKRISIFNKILDVKDFYLNISRNLRASNTVKKRVNHILNKSQYKWHCKTIILYALWALNLSCSSAGLKTPNSVTMPVISSAGVTSNAGFQHDIPERCNQYLDEGHMLQLNFRHKPLLTQIIP